MLYIDNKMLYIDNKILYIDNKILYIDNKMLYIDNKILYIDNKILYNNILNEGNFKTLLIEVSYIMETLIKNIQIITFNNNIL